MGFPIWLHFVITGIFTGWIAFALVKGRLPRVTRREDPTAYWGAMAAIVTAAALSWAVIIRAYLAGRPPALSASLLFAPYCLFLVVNCLRTGEIVFGNNRFPRRGRAQPYWTILFLCFVFFAFNTGAIVHGVMRGRL